jgi:hypothetical protein
LHNILPGVYRSLIRSPRGLPRFVATVVVVGLVGSQRRRGDFEVDEVSCRHGRISEIGLVDLFVELDDREGLLVRSAALAHGRNKDTHSLLVVKSQHLADPMASYVGPAADGRD